MNTATFKVICDNATSDVILENLDGISLNYTMDSVSVSICVFLHDAANVAAVLQDMGF